ncbi:MAG: M20/M25/M40 family metallo-hydrolase, partial [Candidatus Humimicrobiaceae bacterium]
KLNGDLYFTGIVGEETGGTGTRYLINEGFDVDYVIVGEPTDLNLCISHKGAHLLEITIKGRSAHASMPEKGVNAISAMSEFIMKTKERLVPELNKRIQDMVGSPTLSFGLIRGGKKVNMVADTCTVEIDRRWINNESIPQIISEFKEILEEVCKDDPVLEYKIISTLPPDGYFGPFIIPGDHEFVLRLKKILMDQGFDSSITGMQGWTDGATTMHSGIPTIVFGPGSMDQAHTDTEWIEVAQLTQAVKCYLAFIEEICGWDK